MISVVGAEPMLFVSSPRVVRAARERRRRRRGWRASRWAPMIYAAPGFTAAFRHDDRLSRGRRGKACEIELVEPDRPSLVHEPPLFAQAHEHRLGVSLRLGVTRPDEGAARARLSGHRVLELPTGPVARLDQLGDRQSSFARVPQHLEDELAHGTLAVGRDESRHRACLPVPRCVLRARPMLPTRRPSLVNCALAKFAHFGNDDRQTGEQQTQLSVV